MMGLQNKAAIITGGGRGIGKAIALMLASHGADCVIADLNQEDAVQVADEICRAGGKALAVKADVSNEGDVASMVAACIEAYGTVDVLVNNAGIASTTSILETSLEAFDRQIRINLNSVFLCTKAVFPSMMSQRSGKIVNIASIAGKRGGGVMGKSAYASSKGAVIAFTKAAAREAGPFGINVNAITPGLTATAMTDHFTGEVRQSIIQGIPMGRVGEPVDIANAVYFLASSYSDFITGEIMDVDGGFMMD